MLVITDMTLHYNTCFVSIQAHGCLMGRGMVYDCHVRRIKPPFLYNVGYARHLLLGPKLQQDFEATVAWFTLPKVQSITVDNPPK
jgi:hypothetical protein